MFPKNKFAINRYKKYSCYICATGGMVTEELPDATLYQSGGTDFFQDLKGQKCPGPNEAS